MKGINEQIFCKQLKKNKPVTLAILFSSGATIVLMLDSLVSNIIVAILLPCPDIGDRSHDKICQVHCSNM